MATIQEQLENAVLIYNKCAGKVNKFINGGDTETIESDSGNKPTLAKIAKDAKDMVDSSIISLTEKAKQVANDKNEILQIKNDIDATKIELENKVTKFGVPVGQLSWFTFSQIPDGYLRCNGSEITKEMFPDLCKVLNNGDEKALTATLPNALTTDGRGRFLRDIGTSGIPLKTQEDEIRAHSHDIAVNWNDHNTWAGIDATSAHHSNTYSTKPFGGDETRPVSLMAVLCIKAYNGVINDGSIDLQGIPIEVQSNKLNIKNLESKIEDFREQTVLWHSPSGQAGGNYILSESMKNFKEIIIESRLSNGQRMHDTIYPNLLWNNGHFYAGRITGSYTEFKCINDTKFSRVGGSGSYNMRIIGVK